MPETFEAYRTRVLSYLGDEDPIGVQQATPSQLERRLRDVAPEELIRRPAPEKWSIAEIVAHLADAELAIAKHAGESGRGLICRISLAGIAALFSDGSGPAPSHKTPEPQLSCRAFATLDTWSQMMPKCRAIPSSNCFSFPRQG